jgi:hypothetical protein
MPAQSPAPCSFSSAGSSAASRCQTELARRSSSSASVSLWPGSSARGSRVAALSRVRGEVAPDVRRRADGLIKRCAQTAVRPQAALQKRSTAAAGRAHSVPGGAAGIARRGIVRRFTASAPRTAVTTGGDEELVCRQPERAMERQGRSFEGSRRIPATISEAVLWASRAAACATRNSRPSSRLDCSPPPASIDRGGTSADQGFSRLGPRLVAYRVCSECGSSSRRRQSSASRHVSRSASITGRIRPRDRYWLPRTLSPGRKYSWQALMSPVR